MASIWEFMIDGNIIGLWWFVVMGPILLHSLYIKMEIEITQISSESPEILPNQFSEVAIMEIQDGRHNNCFMLSWYI